MKNIMRHTGLFVQILLVLTMLALTGCFKANKKNLGAFTYPDKADVTADQYILEPPDEVTVISSSIPELSGGGSMGASGMIVSQTMTQTIRPDGVISFERIGEISVAGKTPHQVAELIAQRLASLYQLTGENPVDVRVRNGWHGSVSRSKNIYRSGNYIISDCQGSSDKFSMEGLYTGNSSLDRSNSAVESFCS